MSKWAKASSAADGTPSSSVEKEKKKAMGINRRVRPPLHSSPRSCFLPPRSPPAAKELCVRTSTTTTLTHAKGRLAEVLLLHAPHGAPHKYLEAGKVSPTGSKLGLARKLRKDLPYRFRSLSSSKLGVSPTPTVGPTPCKHALHTYTCTSTERGRQSVNRLCGGGGGDLLQLLLRSVVRVEQGRAEGTTTAA